MKGSGRQHIEGGVDTNLSGNALVMKELNISLVRRTLRLKKQATRQQIAEATGLSTVTIASIIRQLAESGEVAEVDLVASNGGRPARLTRFNENHDHVLVLFTHEEDGKDVAHVRVANLFGECRYERNVDLGSVTPDSFEPLIDEAIAEFPTVRAIGFGLPGVELDGRIISMDYPALVGTAFLDRYRSWYLIPVILENDVNAAALGYCRRHRIESEAATVYLYFPRKYPPGAGICLNGRLYRGNHHYAGEVQNLPLGVDWTDQGLYESPERCCAAIAKLITAMGAVADPESVVLSGGFLTAGSVGRIREICSTSMTPNFVPAIRLSDDFTLDYQNGIIEETLALLETTTLPSP